MMETRDAKDKDREKIIQNTNVRKNKLLNIYSLKKCVNDEN